MHKWTDEQEMIRDAISDFVKKEIVPIHDDLEHGDLPPYDVIRKLFKTFGMDSMAEARFARQLARRKAEEAGEPADRAETGGDGGGGGAGMQLIPIIEICRYSPGLITAMGVSMGLAAAHVMKGTSEQMERWGKDLMTFEKIGAWAITEPNSGSDAFGSMKATARRDGDEYVLNGSKTFITNGPYADTTVFICKLDEGNPPEDRKVLAFVLDKGMDGFEQTKPLRKMGLHSSPTGELFLNDVRVGIDRLIGGTEDPSKGGGKDAGKDAFSTERSGVASMALGIIYQCIDLCVDYAKNRVQFGKPIADFQMIQEKLALMEVARLNVENMVFRFIETREAGDAISLSEASAMKLYAARAANEVTDHAVQIFGGNGYMSEFKVEQLARDARVLRIYAGTDEIQITHIARGMLA